MDKFALLIGGIMFIGEGFMKFFHFKFLGMDMPCGASLMIVGFGLALSSYNQIKK